MEISSKSTFREAQNWASIFLRAHDFSSQDSRLYLLWLMDWSLTDYVLHQDDQLGEDNAAYLQASFARLVQDEPIQYIVGYQDFNGRRFRVSPDTLIPREETRGILDLARPFLRQHPRAKVLDIGTGTGILAISLKLEHPKIQVLASDISPVALAIAQENGDQLGAEVEWRLSDLFANIKEEKFDLIVSNPPYISPDEVSLMDQSVIKYEPKLALFADKNGLEIYERLAREAHAYLNPSGQLIMEMGFRQGSAIKEIFRSYPNYQSIHIHQDFNGLDRFIIVES